MFGIMGTFYGGLFIVMLIAIWKIFEKAGRPGWEGIIPIYGLYIMITQILKKEWWYLLLLFIPLVNIVVAIIILTDLAKAFGRSGAFAILFFIAGIGYMILGFGSDKYVLGATSEHDEFLNRLDSNY